MIGHRELAEMLAELRWRDQESARMLGDALDWIESQDVAQELHRMRALHARHQARIDDIFFEIGDGGPPEIRNDVKESILLRAAEVTHARSVDDILRTLLEAEQDNLRAYQVAAAEPNLPADIAQTLRLHEAEERDHVRFLQMRVPAYV